MQIDEVGDSLHDRSVSLGKHPTETMDQWLIRSHHNNTYTWDYEPNDYITEVSGIAAMKYDIEGVLQFIRNIYSDLLGLINCDICTYDRLEEMDDPDQDIIEMLDPKVCLDGLDDAMANDDGLGNITQRIKDVIIFGWSEHEEPLSFHIRGTHEINLVLHANKFSTFQKPHQTVSPMWYT